MKKFYVLWALLLVAGWLVPAVSWAQADPHFVERFEYTPDVTNTLDVQSSSKWTGGDVSESESGIYVTSGSLSYEGLASSGNKISLKGDATAAYVSFTPTTDTNLPNVYYSFMLRVTTIPVSTTGGYFMRLSNGVGSNGVFAPVGIRASGDPTKFRLGFGKRGINAWLPDNLEPNTTYYVVVSYSSTDTDPNSSDPSKPWHAVKIWLNPTDFASEPTATMRLTTGANAGDMTAFRRIVLDHNNTNNADMQIDIDEIRVGTAWAEMAVLPVTLRKFDAVTEGNHSKISWTTLSEYNNDHFEVQRSTDGKNFETMQQVAGKGSTGNRSDYVVYDENPRNGINYYRLLQFDKNGDKTDLGVKAVSFNLDNMAALSAYASNALVKVFLKNYQDEKLNFTFTSVNGDVLSREQTNAKPGQTVYSLNLKTTPATGIYVLNVRGNEGLNKSIKVFVP